jgi:mannose-6-phosphate isomerase
MFVRIDNVPRDYAWGSTTGIAALLGRVPSGRPEAELWLGVHPGSPSMLVHPVAGAATLAELLAGIDGAGGERRTGDAAAPGAGGGQRESGTRLPFLLKVLSAAAPLSLQAHPSPEQARAGFARENAAGIALDAPQRNYKDPFHKPELFYAITSMDALCGFRALADSVTAFDELIEAGRSEGLPTGELDVLRGLIAGVPGAAGAPEPENDDDAPRRHDGTARLRAAVGLLLGGGAVAEQIVAQATAIALSATGRALDSLGVVRLLAQAYPGDPGVVLALLLNHVTLPPGEALYLPAGNIHAYLSGTGIELMSSSDNVLRGGLTPKHVDVPELLRVLDFTPVPPPVMRPERLAGQGAGVEVFRPDVPDFELVHVTADASIPLLGPAIALCTAGEAIVRGRRGELRFSRGQACYISPDETELRFEVHDGEVFVAQPNACAGSAVGSAD